MRPRWGILALLLVFVSGACATGKDRRPETVTRPGATDSAVLRGSGSTMSAEVMERWVREYRTFAPGVTIDFRSIGGGTAAEQLRSGGVDFGISESPDVAGRSADMVAVPSAGIAVVIAYNLPGLSDLRLSAVTLAAVFGGSVTSWNDSRVAADNPGRTLPSLPVKVVHRSDPTAATLVLSRYLREAAPEAWGAGSGSTVVWPRGTAVTGPDAMTDAVLKDVGAVGYASATEARRAGVGVAAVGNAAGRFSTPTADAMGAFLMSSVGTPDDLALEPRYDTPAPFSYPLTTFTYLHVPRGEPATQKATALRNFLRWVLSEGQRSIEAEGSAPLPLPLVVRTLEALQSDDLRPRR